MTKKTITLIAIIGIVVIGIFWTVGKYNTLVNNDESCSQQWSKVESQYQRRTDLIPNLVNTVKGYAAHEKETFTQVIAARNQATQAKVDPNKLDQKSIQNFQKSQDNLSSAISKLMVVVERYPELKANQNFLELQSQLEGTENRIAVERQRFADIVKSYNTSIRRFPTNMIATMFSFEKKAYFEAQKGAENAPKVEF
ncbi:MAG: lemA [Bacteroidetes bacterium]|nr:lemA [Bacteroidota bacterium]